MNFTSTTRSERRLQEILKQRLRNLNQTGNQLTSLAVGDAAVAILCSTCNQQERNQKFAARTSLLLQLSKGQLVQVFVCCACVGTRRHSICQIKRFVQHQCFQVRTCHLSLTCSQQDVILSQLCEGTEDTWLSVSCFVATLKYKHYIYMFIYVYLYVYICAVCWRRT